MMSSFRQNSAVIESVLERSTRGIFPGSSSLYGIAPLWASPILGVRKRQRPLLCRTAPLHYHERVAVPTFHGAT